MSQFDFTAAEDAPEQTSLMSQTTSTDNVRYDFSAAEDAPPFLPTSVLQSLLRQNPDQAARSQALARKMELPSELVQDAYSELEQQEIAEKLSTNIQRAGVNTQRFMSVPENVAVAHDDVLELGEIEESGNAFIALLRSGARAPFTMAQFGNQTMAYFYGAMDSAAKGVEQLTGLERGGAFEQGQKYWLAQSKYIGDEVLNSELLAVPERLRKSLWDNPQLLLNLEYLVTQVGEAAGSMLPMVAAYVASGGSLAIPAAIGGLQEAAGLYEDLIRDGVSEADAATAATSFGVVVGMLDKIGLSEITKKIPTKTIMQNLARRASGGFAEGATEYLEEPFQAAFSALAKGKDMNGVVQDVVASFKNVDVIPGAFLLGASGALSSTAKRVENSALAAMKATQNGAQLAALSEAVASSKLGQRAPKKLGEFIDSVLPAEAKEQFIDARQFATVFQEAISKEDSEGLEIASPEEVLSRLEVSQEVFQDALQKDTVMPLSVPTLMQNLTKDERELILPHIKATPLSMSEAESAQHDSRGEAYRVFSEYSQDEEHKSALEAERTRIVDGLIKQGVHEKDAVVMAAIPHAFAQSYGTYGLDSVDFLRRIHVGEVGKYFNPIIDNEKSAQGDFETELNQGQRGSLSFLPENNYLIKLESTADQSTFVHECAHVFLAELSRMTGQTQVFDQYVSSPKLDDLAAEQEMLGEAMNAGLEDSLSAINPEGKPYAEVNPEWAGKEEGYRTATIQKDFDDALHNNDEAYQAEKAKLAQVIESQPVEISPQLLKDMAVLRKWMKLKKGDAITTVHHEQFARGFEAYLREGEAPSVELAHVFQRFRNWLLSIYKNVKSLHVNLNDEVRDVLDRMLATSEQTSELMYEELSQLTPSNLSEHVDLDEYDRQELERSQTEAERQTTASMDRATLRERNKRWRDAREQAREVVENEPVYQAILWMSKRTGLDEAYMLEYYGKDTVKVLRQKHRGLIKKDGQDGDDIATEFGYDDSDSMVYAMVDAPSFKDRVEQLAEEFVKVEDEQLVDEYGTTLAGEARGEYLEKLHAAEVKKRRGITYTPREFLRKVIQGNTPFTTVRDAMRYDVHQHTIRKHLKLREEIFAKGQNTPLTDLDYRKASFHLDKIRMGYEMIGEAVRVREEAAKVVARAKKFAKSKSIETHFSDHISVLVQRFKMGGKSFLPKNSDHMSSLKTLIESQNDIMETAPSFSEWLVEGNESVDWKDLSVGELRELNDLLSFLDHHGREQTKENERISKERLDNTADVTTRGAEDRKRKKWEYGTVMRKVMDAKDKIFASLDTLQYLLATFDEVNDTGKKGERGANIKLIFDELVKAQNVQSQMWHEMQFKIRPALSHLRKTARNWEKQHGKSFARIKLTAELRKQIGEGANVDLTNQQYLELPVPDLLQQDSRKWTADSIIGLMLHTGTASNLERVYAGYPELKENHVLMYLKSMLTHKDWDAIQQIWDAVDTLYPEVDRVHKQLNGFHMTKTEALPFGIERDGKIKKYQGGYFPAVYDSTLPQTHFIKQQVELDEAISRAEAVNQTPAARSGFTKGRKAKAPGFPLKLSVNVAVEHLYDTIHYTTHAEALRFADRLTRHKKWEKAFTEVMGSAAYDAVRGHLKAIARPEKPVRDVWQRIGENLRTAATPFILGWNFGVATKQVFSLPGGVHDIGMKEFCKGLKTVISNNPRKQMKWIHEVSPFMRDRVNSMDRELADMANKFRMDVRTVKVFGKELSHQDAVDLGFWPIRMADMATTYVLWVSSYEKAMRQGKNPEEAVFYADDIIRKSQPSSQAIDRTMWQRHQGALRMLSMFQTYTVRTYGARQRHHFRAMLAGKMSKVEYAKYVLYDQIFPPIAMQLAFALMWGNAPDSDDDEQVLDFLLDMGAGAAIYQFAGIPLVSAVFSPFDAGKAPAATGLDIVQRSLRTGWEFLENPDDKQTERMLWSLFHLGSYVTKVPASQVARRFKKGMEQLEDGEGTPVNLLIPEPKK